MNQDIVLSGIRATGRLHFGNLIGAVQKFVSLQEGGSRCLFFIADWHTLTTSDSPEDLRRFRLEIVKDYLAAGIDPTRSTIYTQSSVPEIAELALYLGMVQPMSELQNIPTFKDLVRKHSERVSLGLLTYPVLMAADILGPKATLIPVGEDQEPNVELARKLARRFNEVYGNVFPIPEMIKDRIKIVGLDGNKMGKSDGNGIDIDMPIEQIRERYRKFAITDPNRQRRNDPGDPYNGCASIYPVHEIITPGENDTREIARACKSAGIGCAECKDRLVNSIATILEPFQERRRELATQDGYAQDILVEGGKQVRARVIETVTAVRELVGISWRT